MVPHKYAYCYIPVAPAEVVAEDSTPRQKTECLPTTIDPLTGVAESNENVDAFRPTILYEEHMKVCKKLEDQLEKAMEANETQGSRISELEQQLKTLKLSGTHTSTYIREL